MDIKEAELTDFRVKERHPWELARLDVVYSLIKSELKKNKFITLTVLDIGCGDTFVVENLAKRFPQAKFVAIDTAFTPELIEKYSLKISDSKLNISLYSELDAAMLGIGTKVSIVLLLDVIEHIENDISFLQSVAKFPEVTNDTSFIITVPAFQGLYCSHDVFLGHYRRYTNKSLKIACEKAYLKVTTKGYFFSSLLLARALSVLFEKIFKTKDSHGVGNWKGSSLGNRLYYKILIFDHKIGRLFHKSGINIFGLSNYAICKKFVL